MNLHFFKVQTRVKLISQPWLHHALRVCSSLSGTNHHWVSIEKTPHRLFSLILGNDTHIFKGDLTSYISCKIVFIFSFVNSRNSIPVNRDQVAQVFLHTWVILNICFAWTKDAAQPTYFNENHRSKGVTVQVWFNTNLNQLSLSHSKSYLIKVRLTSHNLFKYIRRLSYYAKKDNYAVDKR